MIGQLLNSASEALALLLSCGVLAAALGAALARSLFAMTMYAASAGALAGAALLAQGAGDAALLQILIGVGVAPFIVFAVMLLSARAAKPQRGKRAWLTLAAAGLVAAVVLWGLPQLGPPSPSATQTSAPFSAWLAPLLFVAAAGCFALLGFGERGAFERAPALSEFDE